MLWRNWSDYKQAQVVNGLIAAFLLVCAWRMWSASNGLWTVIFIAGTVVNIVGGAWRYRQKRRGLDDVERPNEPSA